MLMPAVLRFLAGALAITASIACAQHSYPSQPIKVLMGFPAGGAPDTALRRIAARLEQRLGVPIIVENRLGASGTIAATAVARAEPNGYTLLFGVAANMAVAPAVMKDVPYDPVTAFAPIVEVARGPYLFLVRGDAAVRSMREFVAWASAQPGKLNYASPGVGSVHYFATEMLLHAAHIDVLHVPTSGSLYPTILGGQVDAMFDSMPSPMPHLVSGKLRALAVTGDRRLPTLPNVPTLAEEGIDGVDVSSWWGFVGPAAMPREAITRLNAEINAVVEEPGVKSALASLGIETSAGSPEAFAAFIALEARRWRQIAARFAKN